MDDGKAAGEWEVWRESLSRENPGLIKPEYSNPYGSWHYDFLRGRPVTLENGEVIYPSQGYIAPENEYAGAFSKIALLERGWTRWTCPPN